MEKVGPPTGLLSLAAGLSLIRMDRVHTLQGGTARLSVSVKDKAYLPVDPLSITGGIFFILMDQTYPLLSLAFGTSVVQMGKVYPPADLRSLTGGRRIMTACGRRLLDARRERTVVPGSARWRPRPAAVSARRVSHRSSSLSRAKRWTTASIATSGA